jgi:type I site-specific restriction endonuclease
MSKIYETGHAKNVANFEILLAYVIGYGSIYNPSKTSITVSNMQGQLAKAKDTINELHVLIASWNNAVAVREVGFEPLRKLFTRLLNALKATDTPQQVIDNVGTINRKLQGKRVSDKLTEDEKSALVKEGKSVRHISVSQQGYDNRLDHFDKLIKLLASIPLYMPNETELKIDALSLQYSTLTQLNFAVTTHRIALSNVRLLRNEVMYNSETGMVATGRYVKTYVKSVFGSSSVQYKQVSGLVFRMVK